MAAWRLGIRTGMRIGAARALRADLDIRMWDDTAIGDAVLAGTTTLLRASPQVTPAADTPGMWWIGATGLDALGGEKTFAHTLLHIALQWHPDARVAIADSCVAARAATWALMRSGLSGNAATTSSPSSVVIIPPGRCAHYLAPAPLGLVPMSGELREVLQALGMRTIGALAALDAAEVEERWGREGLIAWRLSRGDDPRRPGLVRVEAPRNASVELPGAVDNTASVLFVVRAQLQRLLNDCVRDGRSAAAIAVTLTLDAGRHYPLGDINSEREGFGSIGMDSQELVSTSLILAVPQRTITREVRPARPLARLDPLFDQCRMLLERWNIPAPVIAVSVSIPATAPLAADQGDLLTPSWRDEAMNAEAVLARLRSVLDPDQRGDVVVHPEARDTHRTEDTGAWTPADAMTLAAAPLPSLSQHSHPHLKPIDLPQPVLRLLAAPEPVKVATLHGDPDTVWWRRRRITITSAQGPERLSGDWWRGDRYARDYWRCFSDSDGELLLYREDMRWYVQGWYD